MIKQLSFLLLLLSCTIGATAQKDNCKFSINKKDPFTNEVVRESTHGIGPVTWGWAITINQTGDKNTMELRVSQPGQLLESIYEGDLLTIKLENGEIIELPASSEISPVHYLGFQNQIRSKFEIPFDLDSEAFQKFATSPIAYMKMNILRKDVELPKISSKQTSAIHKTFKCLSQ